MTVVMPKVEWPTALEEIGPEEDPTIVLSGTARIGGVPHIVKAIRMHEGLRSPDFKDEVAQSRYDMPLLDELVDEIECLADTISLGAVTLETGHYVFWMAPTEAG